MLSQENAQKASISNKAGQIERFIKEIKIGDVIISVDSNTIAVGTVTSEPYKDENPVYLKDDPDNNLAFKLRRKVKWGIPYIKEHVPIKVQSSLGSSQTVFSIHEHWRALNHWISVIFIKDDSVYFSTKIKQRDNIKNFYVMKYAETLNYIEALSEVIAVCYNSEHYDNSVENINKELEDTYTKLIQNDELVLTTQQMFMSPGDIWGKLNGRPAKLVAYAMAIASLFNIGIVFAGDELKKIEENIQPHIEVAMAYISDKQKFDAVKQNLSLEIPTPQEKELNLSENKDEDLFPGNKPASFTAQ